MTQGTSTRPVIVGIDGSATALRAALLAGDEARRRRAPLRLLHATTRPTRGGPSTASGRPHNPDRNREAAETALRAAAQAAGELAGNVSCTIEHGDPVQILSEASDGAQLLVLGARGLGGVTGLFIGSTASAVIDRTGCPVIVVPAEENLAVVHGRRSVVVGVAGRRNEEAVLTFAFQQADALETDLVAVHSWRDLTLDSALRSVGPLVDWTVARDDEERVLAESLAGWTEEWPDIVVREVIVRDRTARSLLNASIAAKLLVVGSRRRTVWQRMGSTSHAIVHRATCPVAVIPVDEASRHLPTV